MKLKNAIYLKTTIQHFETKLKIIQHWLNVPVLIGAITISGGGCLFLTWGITSTGVSSQLSSTEQLNQLVLIAIENLSIVPSLFVLWMGALLVLSLNEMIVSITPNKVEIKQGPIIRPIKESLNSHQVKSIYIQAKGNPSQPEKKHHYNIYATTSRSEHPQRLFSHLKEQKKAEWLKQEIERLLAMKSDKADIFYSWVGLEEKYNLNLNLEKGERQASGVYHGYDLHVETFSKITRSNNILLTLSGDKLTAQTALPILLNTDTPLDLTPKDLLSLFSPSRPEAGYFLKGSTKFDKETIIYEQKEIEVHFSFLEFLFESFYNLLEAYPHIIRLGGEAVNVLMDIATHRQHPFKAVAAQLLKDIATNTHTQLKPHLSTLLCARCLTRLSPHPIKLRFQQMEYYGCRTCAQSQQFIGAAYVVAILDNQTQAEISQKRKATYVNWLPRRTLFDFNHVEIIQATDEEVERFVVQVGNDTDPYRKNHYQTLPYFIDPHCHLSPNSLRVLDNVFGEGTQGRWEEMD